MSDLFPHLERTLRERKLFRRGERLLVAVSGGLDSMTLLHLLHTLAPRHGWQIIVAHFNHQLRGRRGDADERLVRATAEQLGLPFVAGRANVKRHAQRHGLSLEMAARQLRHAFLARCARRHACPVIALAHHADDQVELFFLRLLRGAGGAGLAGMKWRSPSPAAAPPAAKAGSPRRAPLDHGPAEARPDLVRPLLDVSRAELAAFAREHKIPFHEDETNAARAIPRNRIRHELLPLLRARFQPALNRSVLRAMEIVGAESDLAEARARAWLAGKSRAVTVQVVGRASGRPAGRLVREATNAGETPDAAGETPAPLPERLPRGFDRLAIAVQRRALQLQLRSLQLPEDFAFVEALRLSPGQPVTIRPRVAVARDATGRLRLRTTRRTAFQRQRRTLELQGPSGDGEWDGLRWRWELIPRAGTQLHRAPGSEQFDADLVGGRIVLRHWRPGDRFQPIGLKHTVKLQDWFTNRKVPLAERRRLVVACTGAGEIFWIENQRIGERFKLSPGTKRRLVWEWGRT